MRSPGYPATDDLRGTQQEGPAESPQEGGDAGGEIVACGTPEEVAGNPRSFTGHFLRRVLHLPAAAG